MTATLWRRGRAVTAACVLLVSLARWGFAQTLDGEAVLQTLGAQAEKLRGPLGNPSVVGRIEQHLSVLERARGDALGGRVPPEYRNSLLADAALLDNATALLRSGNRDGALAAVLDVEADLALKRNHVESGLGFSGGGLRTVRLTVRTLRGTQEESGQVVWFVPRGWANDPRRYARFDQMSSPTSASLAPGNYVLWSGEATGGGRQPIVVGGHGESQQTIDLRLP